MKFTFEPFTLDTDQVQLSGPDGPISLEPQVFSLLAYLAQNADRVVSKDELIDNVWEGRIVSDANLNSRINAARRAVNDDGKMQKVIRTFPRKGFRFVADLGNHKATHKKAAFAGQRTRVMVLPFLVHSSDPELGHIADGLTEDIILELSRSKQFTVLSRSISFSYRDEQIDLVRLREETEVEYVVEGSVRGAGNALRLAATLTDTETVGVMWSEQLDGRGDDIFPVLDAITQRVVAAVEPAIKRVERRKVMHLPEAEMTGWQFYLRGGAQLFDVGFVGQEDVSQLAIADFKRAIELEPDLAEAHAGMATAIWHRVGFSFDDSRMDQLLEAVEYARHAAEGAPDNAEIMAALGVTLTHTKQVESGISALRRAVAINSSDTHTKLYLGIALISGGHTQEGIEVLEFVRSAGTHHVSHGAASAWTAMALNFEGRFDEAEPFGRDAVANPNTQFWANVSLIMALYNQRRKEEAAQELQQMRQFRPGASLRGLVRVTPVVHPPFLELLTDTMRQVGLPELPESSKAVEAAQ